MLPIELLYLIETFIDNKDTNTKIEFYKAFNFYYLEHRIKFKNALFDIKIPWFNFNLNNKTVKPLKLPVIFC